MSGEGEGRSSIGQRKALCFSLEEARVQISYTLTQKQRPSAVTIHTTEP